MTILVGLLCQDAVIVGADTSATFGPMPTVPTIEQPTHKITIISDRVIVAGTGAIGLNQRFCNVVRTMSEQDRIFSNKSDPIDVAKELSRRAQQDFGYTGAPKGTYGALIAFPCGKQLHLCELQTADLQPELKDENIWYVSMGSGQILGDPFLALIRKVFWKQSRPNKFEGRFAVAWALQHAVDVNPGGIKDPIDIAVLELGPNGPRAFLLPDSEILEHRESVIAAENHLAEYRRILAGEVPAEAVPDINRPETAAGTATH